MSVCVLHIAGAGTGHGYPAERQQTEEYWELHHAASFSLYGHCHCVCVLFMLQVLALGMSILSRANEYAADAFAVSLGYGEALRNALIRWVSNILRIGCSHRSG